MFSIWDESDEERVIPLMTPNEEARNETEPESTERQNELYSEVWKLFAQSSTGVPVLLPSAMLPRTHKGNSQKTALQNLQGF